MLTHPKSLHIRDFNYALPDERIAQFPLEKRDSSKLLVFDNEAITDKNFFDLPELLPAGTLTVFNDTKVVQVRLPFRKDSGASIELFCLEPAESLRDIQIAMGDTERSTWKCLVGNSKRWKEETLRSEAEKEGERWVLEARRLDKSDDSSLVEFSWMPAHRHFAEVLELFGNIPLPPYMKREAVESDSERYQTVYAAQKGAVAAPTAGLHFTPEVFANMDSRGLERATLTLHVGAGTFRPVKAETMADHDMHAEEIYLEAGLIRKLLKSEKVVAVGTTSLRSLESMYWLGVRLHQNPDTAPDALFVHQWDPYELPTEISLEDALNTLLAYLEKHNQDVLHARTALLIAPGFQFRIAHGLITNFHQPESTLLLLISAFIGDSWKSVYEHALQSGYRFLSYGDSSLLWRKD